MKDALTPDSLQVGSLVGPWRVEGYAGRGAYGVVYRARRAGHPGSQPVALKLALFASDPRFEREEELLSRFRHPAFPQLLDRGMWHATAEVMHPYLVMEWIRGLPLYDWARKHHPSSRQVLQVVAQVGWGLEVLHRSGCLHRDIKGGNILVEPEGRAVITDLGSGTWAGAPPLTDRLMAPGTHEYRSPEALLFELKHWGDEKARYRAGPGDDLYALGVSVYQLLAGVYPPPPIEPEELRGAPVMAPPPRVPPQEINARVGPRLSALVERMLARQPEARGLARAVAEAADSAAEHPEASEELPLSGPQRPVAVPVRPAAPAVEERPAPPAAERPAVEAKVVPVRAPTEPYATSETLRPLFAAAALVLVMAGVLLMGDRPREETHEVTRVEKPDGGVAPDAGTTGLGDDTVTTRVTAWEPPPASESVALDIPKQPLDGQRRPPCLRSGEVVIKGGCWKRMADTEPPCRADEYEWEGLCYEPVRERPRPPTSKKPQ